MAALLGNLFGHPSTGFRLPAPELLEDVFYQVVFPRNFREACGSSSSSAQEVSTNEEKFEVHLNVQHFKPEEITVKVSGEKVVTVEAKHEERKDEHGSVSRHFVRKYNVPAGFDLNKLESKMSADGVLTLSAPKIGYENGFRNIPVVRTDEEPAVEVEMGEASEEKN